MKLLAFLFVLSVNFLLGSSTTVSGNRTERGHKLPYYCPKDPCARYPDFYWRPYTGEVPNDAIVGGFDENGYNIYVGQVLYGKTEALIPANIFVGRTDAWSCAWNISFNYEHDVKILCAQNRNDYRWIATSVDKDASKLPYRIPGGTEIKRPVYIGRTLFENRLVIGKIFNSHEPNKGLWTPKNDGGVSNFDSYDVLVYDPKY